MKKILFTILTVCLTITLGYLLFGGTMPFKDAAAGAGDNVSGFAWSENIGWISFNNTSGGGGTSYGVDINASGVFSGYAWSENIGWISFAPSGPYPGNPQQSVRVNLSTGAVTGWARAASYGSGWDGWIEMDSVSIELDCAAPTYQEFSGWAWGSDVVGWINFSDSLYQVQTNFVFNDNPVASNLSVDQGDYCTLAFRPTFSWDYSDIDGDPQDRYQVQIDDDANIADNPLIDSCVPAQGTCASGNTAKSYLPASPSSFAYGVTYYWRVKVWDDKCGESSWQTGQFTTPDHEYPTPLFEWSPSRPSQGELTQFCSTAEAGTCDSDVSLCYNNSDTLISCSGSDFIWTLPSGSEFSSSTTDISENPAATINDDGWQNIYLNIDDGVGSCTSSVNLRISAPLPKWKEIAP